MITIQASNDSVRKVWSTIAGFDTLGIIALAQDDTIREGERLLGSNLTSAFNCPEDEIYDRVKVNEPLRTGKFDVVSGVYVTGKQIPLKRFGAMQAAAGVLYRPYKAGSAKLELGAFGPDIPRLGRHVWKRRGTKRTPIKRVDGVSLRKDPVAADVMKRTQTQIDAIYQRNLSDRMRESIRRPLLARARTARLRSTIESIRRTSFGRAALRSQGIEATSGIFDPNQ